MNYSALDLTWTIMRVDRRTPTLRNGPDMMRLLASCLETISRKGYLRGNAGREKYEGTTAIVPYAYGEPHRH